MRVTGIERQKHHPRRFNIYLDDELALGVHEEILRKADIRLGDELEPATIAIIKSHEETALARESAFRLLALRQRTMKELRLTLIEREFDPEIIDGVILELQRKGYIDDRKFAASFIRDSRIRRPAGKSVLYHKLRLKGIDRALIEEALNEEFPAETEEELAYATAVKILNRFRTSRKPPPPEQQERRLAKYLVQRGFPWSTIRPVLKKMFTSTGDSP